MNTDRMKVPKARSAAALAVALITGFFVLTPPSSADVSAVKGSAFGYYASVSLFGGPPGIRGPEPTVTLPATGGNESASAASGNVTYGPAIIFTSGPITVSTQGTPASGSVTSTADIQNVNTSGQEVFTASAVSSTCTAAESGVTGSTTITGGRLQTSEGNPDVEGDETYVDVPVNPAPNTTYEGQIESVGDRFRYVFNEQIVNPDGTLTVNAGHQILLGPTAVGDLIFGQVVCDVTVTTPTTTTTQPATTTTQPATTTTQPATTTTQPATTTTQPATTTTQPATTTTQPATTTTQPATTTTQPATTTTQPATTTTQPATTTTQPATTTTQPATTTTQPATTTTQPATTTTQPATTTTIVTGPTCFGKPATIVGTPGRDRIRGTNGPDVIVGLGGNDRILGRGGNDLICAGDGNDRVVAGSGNDSVDGGAGNDHLIGNGGNDSLDGGAGRDHLIGNGGNDSLDGGTGRDRCTGNGGRDSRQRCESGRR